MKMGGYLKLLGHANFKLCNRISLENEKVCKTDFACFICMVPCKTCKKISWHCPFKQEMCQPMVQGIIDNDILACTYWHAHCPQNKPNMSWMYRWMQRLVACLCAQKLGIPFVPAPYSSYKKIQIIFGTVCGGKPLLINLLPVVFLHHRGSLV